MTVNWGSIPDLVTSAASLLALGAATWAAIATNGQLTVLKKESTDRAVEQERSHAAGVAVWLEWDPQRASFRAMVINTTRLPIYEVTIAFINPNESDPFFVRQPVLEPRTDSWELSGISHVVTRAAAKDPAIQASWFLRSEQGRQLRIMGNSPEDAEEVRSTATLGPVGLTISFTDAENRRWHRNISGMLASVDSNFQVIDHSSLITPG